MQHFLKCDRSQFQTLSWKEQKCTVRFDDRNFVVGDEIIFVDYNQDTKRASGDSFLMLITHIQRGYGLPDGYVAISVEHL